MQRPRRTLKDNTRVTIIAILFWTAIAIDGHAFQKTRFLSQNICSGVEISHARCARLWRTRCAQSSCIKRGGRASASGGPPGGGAEACTWWLLQYCNKMGELVTTGAAADLVSRPTSAESGQRCRPLTESTGELFATLQYCSLPWHGSLHSRLQQQRNASNGVQRHLHATDHAADRDGHRRQTRRPSDSD